MRQRMVAIRDHLKLFRPFNLLIIFSTQIMMVWYLAIPSGLLWVHYPNWLLAALSTMLCAAAGYLFNNRMDSATDEVNRPGENLAAGWNEIAFWMVYLSLNVVAVLCAWLISAEAGKITIGAIALLFFYNTQLKRLPLAGNIVVALLSALAVIFPLFAEIPLRMHETALLGAFAFWVSLLREMAKDAEDRDGDTLDGANTLPSMLSLKQFNLILGSLHFLTLGGYAWVLFYYRPSPWWWYWATVLPLFTLFILFKIYKAEAKEHYTRLSLYYKLLMLAGICSLFFWK